MKALSSSDAKKWCLAQGVSLGNSGLPITQRRTKSFRIPSDAGRRVHLVGEHLKDFRSAGKMLVWFNDWAVWPSGQRMHIFERFLASYGEHRPLIDVPAYVFSGDEFEDLTSFATIGVLFLWDVSVVTTKGRQLLFYSHDEVGWLAT